MLAGERYFGGPSEPALIPKVMESTYRHLVPPELGGLDFVLERAFRRAPDERYPSCGDFARAIEGELVVASRLEVAEWVETVAGKQLAASRALIADIEKGSIPSMRVRARTDEETTRREPEQLTESAVVRPSGAPELTASMRPASWKVRTSLGVLGLVAGGAVVALGAASLSRPSEARAVVTPPPITTPEAPAPTLASEAPQKAETPPAAAVAAAVASVLATKDARPSRAQTRQAHADAGASDAGSAGPPRELEAPTDRK